MPASGVRHVVHKTGPKKKIAMHSHTSTSTNTITPAEYTTQDKMYKYKYSAGIRSVPRHA